MAWDAQSRAQQRAERARQRQAKRKKTMMIFAAVAVLAVTAVVLIALLSRCSSQPEQPPATEPLITSPTQPEQPSQPEQTEPPAEPVVVHFLAAGDLNITQSVVDAGGNDYDYTRAFLDVAPLLAGADLTCINFEGVLGGEPYGASGSAPIEMAYALKRCGVDMLQLANSYSMHRGISGLRATMDAVRSTGLEPLGVSYDSQEFAQNGGFTLFQVEGIRIAVVAFTKGMMDGTALPPGNENMVNLLYTDYDSTYQKVATAKITSILESVQQTQPDLTIALLHWGSEYNDTISKTQKSIKNLLLSNGVDAIIGTHPHRVHPIEFDPEAGTLVAYSLGDFFGDAPRSGSEYSILLDLEITKTPEGATSITGYEYIPIFSERPEDKHPRVLRIREAMEAYESGYVDRVSQDTYEAMRYALERIEDRVQPEEEAS